MIATMRASLYDGRRSKKKKGSFRHPDSKDRQPTKAETILMPSQSHNTKPTATINSRILLYGSLLENSRLLALLDYSKEERRSILTALHYLNMVKLKETLFTLERVK